MSHQTNVAGPDPAPVAGARLQWRVVGASVRGLRHEQAREPCEDAHRWALCGPDALIVAVSDGAGSAKQSEIGAAVAVQAACASACAAASAIAAGDGRAWRSVLSGAAAAALRAVQAEAAVRRTPPAELAATLTLVAATPEVVAAAQVGDGAVVVQRQDGGLSALTTPRSGEYLNETSFLTSPGALADMQFAQVPTRAAGLAVITDGLQMLALGMPDCIPHAPFFAPLFQFAAAAKDEVPATEELAAFLRSPRVRARTDDDLTLVLAVRVE